MAQDGLWTIKAPVTGGADTWTAVHVTAAQKKSILAADSTWPFYAAEAQAEADAKNRNAHQSPGSSPIGGLPLGGEPGQGIGGPLSGLNAIGAFANSLGTAATWVRVAKVAIGAVLVVVGLARMTGTESGVATAATAAAKSVPGVGQAVRGAKAAGTAVKKKAGS